MSIVDEVTINKDIQADFVRNVTGLLLGTLDYPLFVFSQDFTILEDQLCRHIKV